MAPRNVIVSDPLIALVEAAAERAGRSVESAIDEALRGYLLEQADAAGVGRGRPDDWLEGAGRPAGRFGRRLRRCRHCGIRVDRAEMVYGGKACSEDCADELWIKEFAGRE